MGHYILISSFNWHGKIVVWGAGSVGQLSTIISKAAKRISSAYTYSELIVELGPPKRIVLDAGSTKFLN